MDRKGVPLHFSLIRERKHELKLLEQHHERAQLSDDVYRSWTGQIPTPHLRNSICRLMADNLAKAEPEIRRDIKKAHKLPEPEELPGHRRIPRVHHGNQPGGDGI